MYKSVECVEIDGEYIRIVPGDHHKKPISGCLIYGIQSSFPSLCRMKGEYCGDLAAYFNEYCIVSDHKSFLSKEFYEEFMIMGGDVEMLRLPSRYKELTINDQTVYVFYDKVD